MEEAHQPTAGAMKQPAAKTNATSPVQYPKWFGGSASCIAVTLTHPLDLIKVRLQTTPLEQRRGVVGTFVQTVRSDGLKGPYRGLSAALMRQLTYGSTRFAVYESLKDLASKWRETRSLPFAVLFPSAFVSGSVGAMMGNPADMANVRMQNDKSLAPELRQNYRSVFDVWARVIREDGTRGMFRGVVPNSVRAGAMTAFQLACYDGFKQALLGSGLVATTACSPIDVLKTRIMSSMSSGRAVSIWGTVRTLTKTEGLRWVFRGWVPSFARMGPHTAATLLLLEQHRRLYRKFTAQE